MANQYTLRATSGGREDNRCGHAAGENAVH
jgi:hypothetical protein